jgi:hypothetical protein
MVGLIVMATGEFLYRLQNNRFEQQKYKWRSLSNSAKVKVGSARCRLDVAPKKDAIPCSIS